MSSEIVGFQGQQPTPNGLGDVNSDTNAASSLQRAATGMVPDTLESAFATSNLWSLKGRYNNDAALPVLPPVTSTLSKMTTDVEDKDSQKIYQELVKSLPQELQDELAVGLQKRDPDFAAMSLLLKDVSIALSILRAIQHVAAPDATTDGQPSQNVQEQNVRMVKGIVSQLSMMNRLTEAAIQSSTNSEARSSETVDSSTLSGSHSVNPSSPSNSGATNQNVQLREFLKLIAVALASAREFLRSLATQGAERSSELSKAQRDDTANRLKKQLKDIEKQIEAQRKAKEMQKLFKVLGPLTAVCMWVITVATMGAASPLAIAFSVAISTASLALSVADSQTGFMSGGIQKMMVAIGKSLPDNIPGGKAWVQGIIMAVVSVAIIMVAKGAGSALGKVAESSAEAEIAKDGLSSLTSSVATDLGEEASSETVKATIINDSKAAINSSLTQLSTQYSMAVMLASNGLADLFSIIAKKAGADDATADEIGQALQMIALCLMVLNTMSTGGGGGPTKALGKAFERFARNPIRIVQMGTVSTQGVQGGVSFVVNRDLARLAAESGDLKQAVALLNSALEAYKTSIESIQKHLSDAATDANDYSNLLTKCFKSEQQIMAQLFH